MKAKKLRCFKKVAKVIGEERAEEELEIVGDSGLTINTSYTLSACFHWYSSPQGYSFWDSINKGIDPCPNMKKEGVKHDGEKMRPSLLPVESLEQILEVLEFGAKKYAPDNWKKVEDGEQRYLDAMLRHTMSHMKGELVDEESGLPHMAHAGCCLLFLLHFMKEKSDE